MNSQIVIENIELNALRDNWLGDPTTRAVPIYLPPNYASGDGRYPVVFLLQGFAGRGLQLLNDDLFQETIQERLDRLIASKTIRPMIVVMPDGSTRYGGAQYIDSPINGDHQRALLEIVAHVDARYRTLPETRYRGIAGKSSGGFGSTRMGMAYPDVFGLVGDHAGDKYFEMCYKSDLPDFLRFYARAGLDGIRNMLANPKTTPKPGGFFSVYNIVGMASCYSPNPDAPLGVDLPFDVYTGELDDEVWARWLAHDPVNLVATHAENLKKLHLLYFDCGRQDEYNLLYGARIFAQRLTQHNIPHHYEEFEGGHRGLNYRFDVSLAKFTEVMNAG
jgi:enterochelin esterase family protein